MIVVNQMLIHRETYDVSCTECKSDAETQRRLNDVSCVECERATFQILESSVLLVRIVMNLITGRVTGPTCRKD
jgi:Zn finger protein HypA/HybF involved in hydrogenase expression